MPSEHDSRSHRLGVADQPAAGLGETIVWRHGPPLPEQRARTLAEHIARLSAAFGDQPVLDDGGRRLGRRELDAAAARLAGALQAQLPRGGRFAILVANGLPHLLAELAAWRLAAVAVPIFTGYPPARLREMLAAVAPAVVLAEAAGLAALAPAAALRLDPERLLAAAFASAPLGAAGAQRAVDADTPCLIQFTSGSSGTPRGVVLSHDNLCSQQAAFALLWPEIGPGDRLAAYLPWHHSFGALAERLWALSRGATLTVVPGGGRDRELLAATLRAVRPTVFMSVPKIHALAMERGLFGAGSLRWAFTAGAPLDQAVFRWYQQRGIPVYEGWGLTEASPSCTITVPGAAHVAGVVGQPIPGVAVGVRASDGRIFVRGPGVMRGYYGQESPCLQDGMLDSGDLGAWTEAGLRLSGRADHQLKLANGEKVSAAALEAELQAHPAILHAVVALDGGLVAVIEARSGASADAVAGAVAALNAAQEAPWQRLIAVYLLQQPMAVENGMLTASLKVARGRVLSTLRAWRLHGGALLERLALED